MSSLTEARCELGTAQVGPANSIYYGSGVFGLLAYDFSYCGKIRIKLDHFNHFKYAFLSTFSCCANITTIHLQNFLIFPDRLHPLHANSSFSALTTPEPTSLLSVSLNLTALGIS